MSPLVFDIQRFSIHDGPGIRTVIFFKGCNLECPWCQNPESISLKPEIAYYPNKCIDSRDCVTTCAHNAISFNDKIGINRDICARCEKCTVTCFSEAIRVIGKEYTVKELMHEILQDLDYYNASGGGVTFSGGEPTMHIDFIYELLVQCKSHGIQTNIETNGLFSWNKFQKILPLLDLIYFDIKIADCSEHKKYLSRSNEKIHFNMQQLVEAKAPVQFRLPLIPEYTATNKNLTGVVKLLNKCKIEAIHLLPYHSMGEGKGEKVASCLPKLGFNPFSSSEIKGLELFFENENIQTLLYR